MRTTPILRDAEALEMRFAGRVAAALSERAAVAQPDIDERLRFAREQALARVRQAKRLAAAPAVIRQGGSLALAGPGRWWQRLAAVVPLAVLLLGLLFVHQRVVQEQVDAAAEIDSVLLADDLPPAAYTDPGFAEYLKSPPP